MKKLLPYIFLSLLFHGTLALLARKGNSLLKNDAKQSKSIEVTVINLKDFPFAEDRGKVIVEPSHKSNNKKPRDTKFLSEANNSVEKETVKKEMTGDALSPGPRKSKIGTENIDLYPKNAISDISNNFGGGESGKGHIHDAIEGVEEGEITALNTVEFKYASFFNRVKRSVAAVWYPLQRLRTEDPSGRKYLFKNRRTLLQVTLDSKGYIKQIGVVSSSGVDFLDDEAINAFQRCVQFPNPPIDLIKNKHITFYFAFEVISSGQIRILW